MNFEDMQKTWQSQDAGVWVTINPELLLKEVRRNQRQFRVTIFWRDVREVLVALALAGYFSYQGIRAGNWTFELVALACAGIGVYFVADRIAQRRTKSPQNTALKVCIAGSLREINHQIWLLKNVFWWYLLPLLVPLLIVILHSGLQAPHFGFPSMIVGLTVIAVVFAFVYWLNQFAVRTHLVPRREELEALLASLN